MKKFLVDLLKILAAGTFLQIGLFLTLVNWGLLPGLHSIWGLAGKEGFSPSILATLILGFGGLLAGRAK